MAYEKVYQATKKMVIGVTEYNKGDVVPNELVTTRMKDLYLVETVKVIPSEDLVDCGEGGCSLQLNEVVDTGKTVEDEPKGVDQLLIENPGDSEVSVEVSEEPNWEWINSLKSTRDDKNAFDDYAKEKFDVTLNANNKLSDMIEDFKSQLADK
ncbi:hypothetical protein Va1_252 [Vibrio phage Va1]|nr:hypothetical protein Va1_252 [Vibrio phage Va1]